MPLALRQRSNCELPSPSQLRLGSRDTVRSVTMAERSIGSDQRSPRPFPAPFFNSNIICVWFPTIQADPTRPGVSISEFAPCLKASGTGIHKVHGRPATEPGTSERTAGECQTSTLAIYPDKTYHSKHFITNRADERHCPRLGAAPVHFSLLQVACPPTPSSARVPWPPPSGSHHWFHSLLRSSVARDDRILPSALPTDILRSACSQNRAGRTNPPRRLFLNASHAAHLFPHNPQD